MQFAAPIIHTDNELYIMIIIASWHIWCAIIVIGNIQNTYFISHITKIIAQSSFYQFDSDLKILQNQTLLT